MATIPIYDGPQVRTEALRPPQQREIDVSSGLRALGRAGEQVGGEIERRLVADAKSEADTVDLQVTSEWLTWDAQNRRTFTGSRAGEYEVAATKWWETAREKYGSKLSPAARQLIGPAIEQKQMRALATVMERVGEERERHAVDVYDKTQSTEVEFAIDTGNYAGSAAKIRAAAEVFGKARNWGKEQIEAETQKRLGALHLTVVESLAARNAKDARDYYDLNKGEIPATAQNRVEAVLKGEEDNQFADTFASKHAALPLAEQLRLAADIKDPERKQKTLQAVRNTQALVRAATEEKERAASDAAWQFVAQGKRVPETTLRDMNGRERVQLQDWLRETAKRQAEGTPVKTDWGVYLDARERIARGEAVDLRLLTNKLAGGDIKDLAERAEKMRPPGKQDSMMADEQRVSTMLTELGIDKKKEPERAARVHTEVDRRVRQESAARGGRDLTADEKQKIIDDVAKDTVYVSQFGPDPNMPMALVDEEQLADAYVRVDGRDVKLSTVPKADRAEIIAKRRARGLPVTEQAIVRAYLAKKAAEGTNSTTGSY